MSNYIRCAVCMCQSSSKNAIESGGIQVFYCNDDDTCRSGANVIMALHQSRNSKERNFINKVRASRKKEPIYSLEDMTYFIEEIHEQSIENNCLLLELTDKIDAIIDHMK